MPDDAPVTPPAGAHHRVAIGDDVAAAAEVMIRSRAASVPAIPPAVHPPEAVRAWFPERLARGGELWVGVADEVVVAMMLLDHGWIDQLYVDPDHTGTGIGSELVALAQERYDRLQLWTFQSNAGARRFYRRHGFVEVETTDGDNEEGAPDVRCVWQRPPGATLSP